MQLCTPIPTCSSQLHVAIASYIILGVRRPGFGISYRARVRVMVGMDGGAMFPSQRPFGARYPWAWGSYSYSTYPRNFGVGIPNFRGCQIICDAG